MLNRPVPDVDRLSEPYWDAAQREQLVMQKCACCTRVIFPPRPWCPDCSAVDLVWAPVSGRGTIVSFSKLYIEPFAGYAETFPYVIAVVRLDEGPQMMTNIVDSDLDAIRIDAPVTVVFEARGPERKVPQFKLAAPQS